MGYCVGFALEGTKCVFAKFCLQNAQYIINIAFQLCDSFRFDSAAVIDALTNILHLKVNYIDLTVAPKSRKQPNFFKFLSIVHEYSSKLNTTDKSELFCRCKRWKFFSQNKVKICEI